MKLSHVTLFLAVSVALVVLPCHAVERDLTLACTLNLNDCQTALEAVESSCGGSTTPKNNDGDEPSCGVICTIVNQILATFGSGNRRRSLREEVSSNMDGNERKLLFFGIIGRQCRELLERCERLLDEFTCPPTISPSASPSLSPTKSAMPSLEPSISPSQEPTITPKPTKPPTKRPTKQPTKAPTKRPTRPPTAAPIAQMGMGKRREYLY